MRMFLGGFALQDHVKGQVEVLQVGKGRRDEAGRALDSGDRIAERAPRFVEARRADGGGLATGRMMDGWHGNSNV